jgi:hypothetical protein
MIDVKQAVKAATAFAREMFDGDELRHLRVEEVELSDDQRLWNITLGWVEPAVKAKASPLIPAYGQDEIQKLPRVYKVFDVDAESGAVQSMKIRDVA